LQISCVHIYVIDMYRLNPSRHTPQPIREPECVPPHHRDSHRDRTQTSVPVPERQRPLDPAREGPHVHGGGDARIREARDHHGDGVLVVDGAAYEQELEGEDEVERGEGHQGAAGGPLDRPGHQARHLRRVQLRRYDREAGLHDEDDEIICTTPSRGST
jgi:hypothetical protein